MDAFCVVDKAVNITVGKVASVGRMWFPRKDRRLGRYGDMLETHLKEHKHELYLALTFQGKLMEYLSEAEEEINKKIKTLIADVLQREQNCETPAQISWSKHIDYLHLIAENIAIADVICG